MRMRSIFALAALVAFTSTCSDTPSSSSNSGPDKQSLPTPASSGNTVASDSGQGNANAGNAAAAPAQANFLMEAAKSGMMEVELGRLASEKAQNPEVKSYGAMMVADHSKANAELKTLAANKGMALPAGPPPDVAAKAAQLSGLSGAEFDRAYVGEMVAAHEKDVAMFREQSTANPDPGVKEFAAKTLPTLQKHLETIKGIQSRLK